MPAGSIERLDDATEADVAGLADLLVDTVQGGASVGFLLPLGAEEAARGGARSCATRSRTPGSRATTTARSSARCASPARGSRTRAIAARSRS